MKKYLSFLLIIGGIVFLWILWQSPVAQQNKVITKKSEHQLQSSSIAIEYQSSSSSSVLTSNNKSSINSDKKILYRGEDEKHRYTIEVRLKKPIALPEPYLRKQYLVEGWIDGSHFILKIPKAIENFHDITINIRSNDSGKTIHLNPSIMEDLPTLEKNEHMELSIDFEHPQNITSSIKQRSKILPVP